LSESYVALMRPRMFRT